MADRQLPSPEVLRQLLRYDPETGKLFWKERGREWFQSERECKRWNTRYADASALDARKSHGYRGGAIFGVRVSAHKAAWAYEHGNWPETMIDHIDGDASNNRISNLRLVSASLNSRNRKKRSDNASGATGVCWHSRDNVWEVHIGVDRKFIYVGRFSSLLEAKLARKAAENGRGFTQRHGE